MATKKPTPKPNPKPAPKKGASLPDLTLKPGGAVCKVELPLRPLRIYFQHMPGNTRTEAERGLGGLPYTLRIPNQPDVEDRTPESGQILLTGLQPGLTGELTILGTTLHLRVRDYSEDEHTDGETTMSIQGAKRHLMVMGYYDKPYRPVAPAPETLRPWERPTTDSQQPDDKLGNPEIEDAILRFQVDNALEPNGEIERRLLVNGKIDPNEALGFHTDPAHSEFKRFQPEFVAKLAQGGGSAPPDTMVPCKVPAGPAPKGNGIPTVTPLVREIYDGHRFIPVRFARYNPAIKYDPDSPELDERGYTTHDGPILSLEVGHTVTLRLERLHMAYGVPLSVTSSDPGVVSVVERPGGLYKFTGVKGSEEAAPKQAVVEVRYGSSDGLLLHKLYVQVYAPIEVAVAVHFVSIGQKGRSEQDVPRIAPALSQSTIQQIFHGTPAVTIPATAAMHGINHIWRAAGIRFSVTRWLDETIDLHQAGAMTAATVKDAAGNDVLIHEFDAITNLNRLPNHLNMYVVDSMVGGGIGWGSKNTALVAADKMHGQTPSTRDRLVQTFAHEIGHFLGLWHPATVNAKGDDVVTKIPGGPPENHALQDYWSRRMLMYCYTSLITTYGPLAATTRQLGRQSNVGNGWDVGGKMLCCQVVPKIVSSADKSEIETARAIALQNQVDSSTNTRASWNPFEQKTDQGMFA